MVVYITGYFLDHGVQYNLIYTKTQ